MGVWAKPMRWRTRSRSWLRTPRDTSTARSSPWMAAWVRGRRGFRIHLQFRRRHQTAMIDKDTLLKLYRDMLLVRVFEQRLEDEHKRGRVPGLLHTGVGQE